MSAQQDGRLATAFGVWSNRMRANGVDPLDLEALVQRITRWEDWLEAWSEVAAARLSAGREALQKGHRVSAGEEFLRAAAAYHFGSFMFFGDAPSMAAAQRKAAAAYLEGLSHTPYPWERFEVPYGDGSLPVVLRKPAGEGRPPVIVLVPGLDSIKEELHTTGDDLIRRGLAVAQMDGPGQGERAAWPIRHDYEVAVSAVLDGLRTRPDVDGERMGLLGVSLGGYYAARAVRFEERLQAVVSVSGPFRIHEVWESLPILTREALVFHAKAPDERTCRKILESFDLKGVLPGTTTPFLVVAGGRDRLFPPDTARQMATEAGPATEFWLFEEGTHVLNNIPTRVRPKIADWLVDRLGA